MRITGSVENIDVVVSGLEAHTPAVRAAAFEGVVQGLKVAQEASRTLISASDHSLKDLAAMGHPYSAKAGFQIHDPDEIVHEQSGDYVAHLRTIPPVGTSDAIVEGRVVNDDPKDRWIQEGTTEMRARPWMKRVVEDYGDQIAAVIRKSIELAVGRRAA